MIYSHEATCRLARCESASSTVAAAACATVLACTRLGLPVSTTHTLVGAIIGVGLARGLGAVNRDVLKSIFGSWLITVPIAAVLTVILFLLGKFFLLDYIIQAMPQPGA